MNRNLLRTTGAAAAALALALGTAACSSSSDSGGSGAAELNCDAAAQALKDYGAALDEIAGAAEGSDSGAVSAAADKLKSAAAAIPANLPGLPPEAGAFITGSESFADAISSAGTDPEALLAALESTFSNEEFAAGGQAIDTYFSEQCPDTPLE